MGSSMAMWLQVGAVVLLSLALGGAAQKEVCNMKEQELRECQPSVTAPHATPPTRACCVGLAKGDLPCLCSYLDSMPAFGIDRDLALLLPSKCGLTLPANCGAKKGL